MNDFEKIELAFDILEAAEVMQVFDDCVWVKIDREMWNEFNDITDDEDDDEQTNAI
jgi:hypothetical protein